MQPTPPASTDGQSLTKRLLEAAEAGDTVEVQNLLKSGADVNGKGSYGNTPLMSAAVTGHTDAVQALLDKGADVNARGETGRTALMEAAFEGYTDTMRALLDKSADVNAKDNEGWTALFWAAFSQRTEAVRVLLEKGADVNAKNKHDDTALIRSAYGGDTETVRVLLEKGADVNAKDDMARTALIEAARQGHTGTVRALLAKGADVNARDRDGATALSMAERHNYPDVIALLKSPSKGPVNKTPEKTTPGTGDTHPATTPADSVPDPAGAEVLDEKTRAQAFFRMGFNMKMIEVWWSETSDLASGWALSLQQDLRRLSAPGDLLELTSQVYSRLNSSSKQNKGPIARVIHDLRVRLDAFCKAQKDEELFYTAGGFTYRVNMFGEDLKRPDEAQTSVEDSRREILPVATIMAVRCSGAARCKDRAGQLFLDVAAILKKLQLAPTDGAVLVRDSDQIEIALSGEER